MHSLEMRLLSKHRDLFQDLSANSLSLKGKEGGREGRRDRGREGRGHSDICTVYHTVPSISRRK